MFKVLIIDDNPNKIKKLTKLLSETLDLSDEEISVASDVINGKRNLTERKYNLVILDIQIPNRFGETAVVNGGVQLLNELIHKQNGRYNVPDYIIGLTAHDDSFSAAASTFDERLLGLVKFEENSDEWEHKVRGHLDYVTAALNRVSPVDYNYDIAIVCALAQIELDSIKRLSSEWKIVHPPGDSSPYYVTELRNEQRELRIVAAAAPQMGMTASAVLATNMIRHFSPYYLVMTGIAAGVRGRVNIGDILVADPSWDYGSGKLITRGDGETEFLAAPQQLRLNADVRSKFELVKQDTAFFERVKNAWPGVKPSTSLGLHIGPVASGAAVLADQTTLQSIRNQNRNLIGIEMETYGVHYAAANCPHPRPICFSLKSVCDFADAEKNDQFQPYAAYTSASVLHEMVMNHLDFNGKNRYI